MLTNLRDAFRGQSKWIWWSNAADRWYRAAFKTVFYPDMQHFVVNDVAGDVTNKTCIPYVRYSFLLCKV